MIIKRLNTPLSLGKELQVIYETVTSATTRTIEFSLDSEAVLLSAYISATSGDVDIIAFTEGADGHSVEAITFPTISAPTTDLVLKKSASVMRKIRVVVTCTGACSFEVRARGVSAGASSVAIEGSANFQVSQKDIGTTAVAILPAALTDRRGILIMNNNVGGTEILNISETPAKVTTGVEVFPVRPGQNITVDLQAGSEVYGASSSGTIDVKIVEIGGS